MTFVLVGTVIGSLTGIFLIWLGTTLGSLWFEAEQVYLEGKADNDQFEEDMAVLVQQMQHHSKQEPMSETAGFAPSTADQASGRR